MSRSHLNAKRFTLNARTIPLTSGVYLYKDKLGIVIYVGKAGNLRRRVFSYFQKNHKHSRTEELAREIADIEIRKTPTVIEALILEAELIKKYQPKFNVREKDNTSFLYVVFTREPWPKPVLIRGKELEEPVAPTRGYPGGHPRVKSKTSKKLNSKFYSLDPKRVFGPFVSASSIRAALHILRKIFPYSTCIQSSSRVPDKIGDVAISSTKGGLRRSPRRTRNDGRAKKPCFNYQIGLCPGVCVGAITKQEYARNIRNLILFFRGKKQQILRDLKKQMRVCSKDENFEEAGKLRNQIFALKHIRDTALIGKEKIVMLDHESSRANRGDLPDVAGGLPRPPRRTRNDNGGEINIFGRIEGYDISNISGTSAVGSMVVFQNGEANKNEYRRFRIKTVRGINDVAMMREVLSRRFQRSESRMSNVEYRTKKQKNLYSIFHIRYSESWPLPNLIVIDGGLGQVNVAREVLREYKLHIPVIGIAKGFMRKQDRPVYGNYEITNNYSQSSEDRLELARIAENYKNLLLQVRDEAHRFAVSYHRKLRNVRALTSADNYDMNADSAH